MCHNYGACALEPMFCNKRSHRLQNCNKEEPPLATTGESLCAARKTKHRPHPPLPTPKKNECSCLRQTAVVDKPCCLFEFDDFVKLCVCVCESQSGLTFCDPMDCSPSGSSVLGILSRQEYWSGLPCPSPGDLPYPGIKPRSPSFVSYITSM